MGQLAASSTRGSHPTVAGPAVTLLFPVKIMFIHPFLFLALVQCIIGYLGISLSDAILMTYGD